MILIQFESFLKNNTLARCTVLLIDVVWMRTVTV